MALRPVHMPDSTPGPGTTHKEQHEYNLDTALLPDRDAFTD